MATRSPADSLALKSHHGLQEGVEGRHAERVGKDAARLQASSVTCTLLAHATCTIYLHMDSWYSHTNVQNKEKQKGVLLCTSSGLVRVIERMLLGGARHRDLWHEFCLVCSIPRDQRCEMRWWWWWRAVGGRLNQSKKR